MRLKEETNTSRSQPRPRILRAKVEKLLKEKPDITWHRAVRLIVDPDAQRRRRR